MKDTPNFEKIKAPEQRKRRKIAREVATFYDDIAREAEFTPAERRTAFAISVRLYERAGEPCYTPRGISLALIGEALTSRSDSEEARAKTAQRHVSELFNQAIPRSGYQILTRYKAAEDSGRPHQYADHLLPIAAFFSELLAEEIQKILFIKGIEKSVRRAQIEEARQRLTAEALDYLPRCEAEIISPEGESYARVSAPEAEAYCRRNPEYSARPYEYSPPPPDPLPRPLCGADFERLKERAVRLAVDQILEEIAERNSPEEARRFWRQELLPALQRAGTSWSKVAGGVQGELRHAPDLSGGTSPEVADFLSGSEGIPPDKLSGVFTDKPLDYSEIENPAFDGAPDDTAPAAEASGVSSINFETSLEAASFYARDGWPVLPICHFDSETGRCTASFHPETCAGKTPLVAGKGDHKPGDGYTAATTDLGRIRYWFEREFPCAGIGIRLDGHVLIDCDLKDGAGGLESYEYLRDTFDLPETLTAVTHSGGRHYVFRLPEDLPAAWLKSWTRPLDKIALGGIDLKVGNCGLLYAEPTRGRKGVYRWIDPTVPPATIPREACDFFREIRYKNDRPPSEKAKRERNNPSLSPLEFQTDQSQFFRDVPRGDRHKRLLEIGTAIRCQTHAGAAEIADAMRQHAVWFSEPLNDETWIQRTALSIERSY